MKEFKVGSERTSTSSNWKGGKCTNSQGYIYVYCPEHPHATRDGYVREHRIVMERHIGRVLQPKERVHHINEIKTDNRIENLMLFSSESEHQRSVPHGTDKFIYSGREKEYFKEYYRKNRDLFLARSAKQRKESRENAITHDGYNPERATR